MLVHPASGIEIFDSVIAARQGGVGVSAENALGFVVAGVGQGAFGNLGRETQPLRVQPVEKARKRLIFRVPLLQLQVEQRAEQVIEADIVDHETIELVSMDGDVGHARKLPAIFLVHADAHQVRHDFAQAVIVIALHPDHFDVAFGIRELADKAEKFPVLFFQTAEIQVGKNVAQKDKAAITVLVQHAQRFPGPAHFRAQVQVGKDQRVVELRHTNDCSARLLRGDELDISSQAG